MAVKFRRQPDDTLQGTCLSSDAKPTATIPEGSELVEMDTQKQFIFYNSAWREVKPTGTSLTDLTNNTGIASDTTIENMPALQATPTGMVAAERDAIRRNFSDVAADLNVIKARLRTGKVIET